MNKNVKEIVAPIAVLVSICLVVTALLAYVNLITDPVIQEAKAKAEAEARAEVLSEADDFAPVENIELPEGVTEAYRAQNNTGFVFKTAVKGYGGTIEMICGIKADGTLEAVKTTSHSETSGIGSRVVDNGSGYGKKYAGKTVADYTDIDTVSGATISSNAFRKALGGAFEAFELVKEAK